MTRRKHMAYRPYLCVTCKGATVHQAPMSLHGVCVECGTVYVEYRQHVEIWKAEDALAAVDSAWMGRC